MTTPPSSPRGTASPGSFSRRTIWAALAVIALAGAVGSAGGFVLGRHWPIARFEHFFAKPRPLDTREWSVFATSDFPRYEPGRARIGSTLLVLGGFYTGGVPKATARVEALDLATGQWVRRKDMPVALTHFAPAVVRDTVWIAGGFEGDHPGPATARVWRYSPATDQWSRGPDLPQPRGGGALVAEGDTLHYFGGWLPDRNTDSPQHWTLHIGDSAWRAAAPMPVARGHFAGVRLSDGIYALSGNIGHDPIPIDIRSMQRYDLKTRQWSDAPSAPFAVSHTEGSTMPYDDGLLVVGGRARQSGRENQDDVLWFDRGTSRWIHLGRLPLPVFGAVATMLGDTLVAGLGALNGNNPTNRTLWRTTVRNSWHVADAMPVALGEVSGGVIDGKLYLTGQAAAGTLLYDIASGRWSAPDAIAVRPMPGDHQAAEVVNGKLFLLGGMGESAGVLQIFDPVRNQWALGPAMPFAAGSAATAAIGGRIYVAGGIVGTSTTSSAAVLDLTSMKWMPVAQMPLPRNHAAAATDGARLWVFGGRGPGSGDDNVVANGFGDVQCYDPRTNSWTVSDGKQGSPLPLPQARGGMGKAVYLYGEFWIIGGETLNGTGAGALHVYSRVDIYNPGSNSWRRGPDLPTARHGIFPLVDAGQIIVAGGGRQSGLGASNIVEILWPRRSHQ